MGTQLPQHVIKAVHRKVRKEGRVELPSLDRLGRGIGDRLLDTIEAAGVMPGASAGGAFIGVPGGPSAVFHQSTKALRGLAGAEAAIVVYWPFLPGGDARPVGLTLYSNAEVAKQDWLDNLRHLDEANESEVQEGLVARALPDGFFDRIHSELTSRAEVDVARMETLYPHTWLSLFGTLNSLAAAVAPGWGVEAASIGGGRRESALFFGGSTVASLGAEAAVLRYRPDGRPANMVLYQGRLHAELAWLALLASFDVSVA